jgi:hypothetical protein
MFDNVYQKFENILKVTEDPVFIQTTVQRKIREFNYYVTEMQNHAHRQLLDYYTRGEGSLLLNIRESLKQKGYEIMTGIRKRLQNTLKSAQNKVDSTKKRIAENIHNSAIPHIVYGLTDRFIFDAFAKIASERNEQFMSEETVEKIKNYRDELKIQVDAEKRQANEPQTESQPLSSSTPPSSPFRVQSQGNGHDSNNEFSFLTKAAKKRRSTDIKPNEN